MQVFFSHSMRDCMFKLVLVVPFLGVCVVLAVASAERVDLSTISPPEAAMAKIDELRRK